MECVRTGTQPIQATRACIPGPHAKLLPTSSWGRATRSKLEPEGFRCIGTGRATSRALLLSYTALAAATSGAPHRTPGDAAHCFPFHSIAFGSKEPWPLWAPAGPRAPSRAGLAFGKIVQTALLTLVPCSFQASKPFRGGAVHWTWLNGVTGPMRHERVVPRTLLFIQ